MMSRGMPKGQSRWSGFSRDAGGHFLQSDRRKRTRLSVAVVIVAVIVLAMTAWVASQADDPKLDLIDAAADGGPTFGDRLDPAAPTALTTLPSSTTVAPVTTLPPISTATTVTSSPSATSTSTEPEPPPTIETTSTTAAVVSTTLQPPPITLTSEAYTPQPVAEVAGFLAAAAALDTLGLNNGLDRNDGQSLLRAPTPDAPLRIYIGGDSMSGTPGQSLENIAVRTDLLDVVVDQRTSSGLVAEWFFDWPGHVENNVAPQGFDVVILTMGANDAQRFIPSGVVGDEAWIERYRRRMDETLRLAGAPGRLVIWIGMPPVTPANIKPVMPQVNAIAEALTSELANVEYVDAFAMFADDEGGFTTRVTNADGRNVLVRAGDGVHYSNTAGDWLAEAVLALVAAEVDSGAPIR